MLLAPSAPFRLSTPARLYAVQPAFFNLRAPNLRLSAARSFFVAGKHRLPLRRPGMRRAIVITTAPGSDSVMRSFDPLGAFFLFAADSAVEPLATANAAGLKATALTSGAVVSTGNTNGGGGGDATVSADVAVVELPSASVEVTPTCWLPGAAYVWDGATPSAVPPSPNVHAVD